MVRGGSDTQFQNDFITLIKKVLSQPNLLNSLMNLASNGLKNGQSAVSNPGMLGGFEFGNS